MIHIKPDVPITYARTTNTRRHHLKMQQPATRIGANFFPNSEVMELIAILLPSTDA